MTPEQLEAKRIEDEGRLLEEKALRREEKARRLRQEAEEKARREEWRKWMREMATVSFDSKDIYQYFMTTTYRGEEKPDGNGLSRGNPNTTAILDLLPVGYLPHKALRSGFIREAGEKQHEDDRYYLVVTCFRIHLKALRDEHGVKTPEDLIKYARKVLKRRERDNRPV